MKHALTRGAQLQRQDASRRRGGRSTGVGRRDRSARSGARSEGLGRHPRQAHAGDSGRATCYNDPNGTDAGKRPLPLTTSIVERVRMASKADDKRVLNEHREVCAFVLHMLLERRYASDAEGPPDVPPVVWMDLGCGDGRILDAVRSGIPDELRASLQYIGCDKSSVRTAGERLTGAGLAPDSQCMKCKRNFTDVLSGAHAGCADLVTLTNVVHEIPPRRLPETLVAALCLLRHGGYLLAYDVVKLTDDAAYAEWNAVTWDREEIVGILGAMLGALGASDPPAVGEWIHTRTTGWTAIIPRAMLLADLLDTAVLATAACAGDAEVVGALARKLDDCRSELSDLAQVMESWGATKATAGRKVVDQAMGRLRLRLREHHALAHHMGGACLHTEGLLVPPSAEAQ
jgi:hypothetical protein